jgi:hypothetical protein
VPRAPMLVQSAPRRVGDVRDAVREPWWYVIRYR